MALVEPEKKGGPYTRKEQEERRLEVYRLHYEENYSAVKIAEVLNVNRNTVSEDLKFWNTQFAREIKTHNLVSKLKNIIQKIEIQDVEELAEEPGNIVIYRDVYENLDSNKNIEQTISDFLGPNWFAKTDKFGSWMRLLWK